ncbi:hypothetical protein PIIN_07724 [Serendipita indica DSM 11827]|uniref:BTB domain-containing protein n=1 Tax=Serendipita indica (strain DSM 11827) TaxID=1109443 RepID=G4TR25_SERID|nr:hypothetical protein PIIN_07724 [Serendipita indica DSM 11827]
MSAGSVIWKPSAPDLPPPRLQFRSTDNVVFHVHDSLLLPQSLALSVLLGDFSIDQAASTVLPLNMSSDALKLILHFVYNVEKETWTGKHGVTLQTVHDAVLGCQQYMMHTVAAALEAPLRANMNSDPLLAAVTAHFPIISNPSLCSDALHLASNSPATFAASNASRRARLPPSAVDLLYQYRDRLEEVMRRQDTARAASILAGFKIDDLGWVESGDDDVPHWKSCRHWPGTATLLQEKLHELMLNILRGVRSPRQVELTDLGYGPYELQKLPGASESECTEAGNRAFDGAFNVMQWGPDQGDLGSITVEYCY